jgi:hypothetical protein
MPWLGRGGKGIFKINKKLITTHHYKVKDLADGGYCELF